MHGADTGEYERGLLNLEWLGESRWRFIVYVSSSKNNGPSNEARFNMEEPFDCGVKDTVGAESSHRVRGKLDLFMVKNATEGV